MKMLNKSRVNKATTTELGRAIERHTDRQLVEGAGREWGGRGKGRGRVSGRKVNRATKEGSYLKSTTCKWQGYV